MRPLDQSSIRKQNLRKMLELLTLRPPQTRQALAEAASLSLMTVSNLVEQLKDQQVLDLLPAPKGQGQKRACGRKAERIALSGARHAWLVVDLSGQAFRFTLLGFDLAPLLTGAGGAGADYLTRLADFLTALRAQLTAALAGRALLGVSVVTPGPYEIASDRVSNQRLPELNAIHIKEWFRRYLGDYDYYVDEDVKFAVRAFSALMAQERCELLYYLYIGEGVGGASVHGGNMIRGLNATAGDAGQLSDPAGASYESRLSLEAFARGLGCPAGSPEQLDAALAQLAAQEPARYRQALDHAAETVAEMLYSVLWVLDPSHILIECRYAQGQSSAFLSAVSTALARRFAATGRALPRLSAPPEGMSCVLRGAVQVLQREWVERIGA